MRVGHGVDAGVEYGPVLDEAVRERAAAHIADARGRGGRVVVGGERLTGERFDHGTFFAPTVVDDVPPDARLMTEETFGPVVGVHASQRRRASCSGWPTRRRYGLAAYVYTGDLERGWAFAEGLEAGAVGVNVNDTTDLQAPFGGWKLSGLGRELGPGGPAHVPGAQAHPDARAAALSRAARGRLACGT